MSMISKQSIFTTAVLSSVDHEVFALKMQEKKQDDQQKTSWETTLAPDAIAKEVARKQIKNLIEGLGESADARRLKQFWSQQEVIAKECDEKLKLARDDFTKRRDDWKETLEDYKKQMYNLEENRAQEVKDSRKMNLELSELKAANKDLKHYQELYADLQDKFEELQYANDTLKEHIFDLENEKMEEKKKNKSLEKEKEMLQKNFTKDNAVLQNKNNELITKLKHLEKEKADLVQKLKQQKMVQDFIKKVQKKQKSLKQKSGNNRYKYQLQQLTTLQTYMGNEKNYKAAHALWGNLNKDSSFRGKLEKDDLLIAFEQMGKDLEKGLKKTVSTG